MAKLRKNQYSEEDISILKTALIDSEGNQTQAIEAVSHLLPNRSISGLRCKMSEISKTVNVKPKVKAVVTTPTSTPTVKRNPKWTEKEDLIIFNHVKNNWGKGKATLGMCFIALEQKLPNRTASSIQKRWETIKYKKGFEISKVISITGTTSVANNPRLSQHHNSSIRSQIVKFFKKLIQW